MTRIDRFDAQVPDTRQARRHTGCAVDSGRSQSRWKRPGPEDEAMHNLARRIRTENSLFVTFLHALHQRDVGQYVMAAELLQTAMRHLTKAGDLLLLARQGFADEEQWQRWVREHCLMDHPLAARYMQAARRT